MKLWFYLGLCEECRHCRGEGGVCVCAPSLAHSSIICSFYCLVPFVYKMMWPEGLLFLYQTVLPCFKAPNNRDKHHRHKRIRSKCNCVLRMEIISPGLIILATIPINCSFQAVQFGSSEHRFIWPAAYLGRILRRQNIFVA